MANRYPASKTLSAIARDTQSCSNEICFYQQLAPRLAEALSTPTLLYAAQLDNSQTAPNVAPDTPAPSKPKA